MGDNKKGLRQKEERLGEINTSNEGYEMKIVEYNKYSDIWVEFQDKHKAKVHTEYKHFKKGGVKNPYHKSVFNVGYLGEGKYKQYVNGNQTKCYITWCNMIKRCYDPYELNRYPSYIDVYVCDEWLCFQNFAKWFYKNYYDIPNDNICLDKDILFKNNKIYSSETCILVPKRINTLFIKCNASRGKYPIGVYWRKDVDKFVAQCQILDKNSKSKQKFLGYFNNEYDAFLAYKVFKENYIKQVADEYKDLIPTKLYDALYRWEVSIDD